MRFDRLKLIFAPGFSPRRVPRPGILEEILGGFLEDSWRILRFSGCYIESDAVVRRHHLFIATKNP